MPNLDGSFVEDITNHLFEDDQVQRAWHILCNQLRQGQHLLRPHHWRLDLPDECYKTGKSVRPCGRHWSLFWRHACWRPPWYHVQVHHRGAKSWSKATGSGTRTALTQKLGSLKSSWKNFERPHSLDFSATSVRSPSCNRWCSSYQESKWSLLWSAVRMSFPGSNWICLKSDLAILLLPVKSFVIFKLNSNIYSLTAIQTCQFPPHKTLRWLRFGQLERWRVINGCPES